MLEFNVSNTFSDSPSTVALVSDFGIGECNLSGGLNDENNCMDNNVWRKKKDKGS
jgi:hypothetical protein